MNSPRRPLISEIDIIKYNNTRDVYLYIYSVYAYMG